MSSSNSDSDSSSNDFLSLNKQLLPELDEDDSSKLIKRTCDIVQNVGTHVAMITSTMLIGKKGPHGGSILGRCYLLRDRKKRHEF
ncbi:hypothetical protein Sjap_010817 [Stephania japonica]|uniref:Uncharacterized protein n=1 Tax=Stephania japonica TaxID=461633 RepID=A0AAP0P6U0_9MAGN